MDPDPRFLPVDEIPLGDGRAPQGLDRPLVVRGAARRWPAVETWSFERLAGMVPDLPVELVVGNREAGATRFTPSSLRRYLASLHAAPSSGPAPYLKEFDLLKVAPALRADLRHRDLLQPGVLHATRSWIGPAGVGTGLHYDYLANVAVQILGTKRWWLARPGAVERLGAVSSKYDPWAVLASASVGDLAARAGAAGDFFTVDLMPGDALHVPPRWWHEVANLSPGLMFGGFHGAAPRVLARSAWVGVRNLRHRLRGGDCTCHPRG